MALLGRWKYYSNFFSLFPVTHSLTMWSSIRQNTCPQPLLRVWMSDWLWPVEHQSVSSSRGHSVLAGLGFLPALVMPQGDGHTCSNVLICTGKTRSPKFVVWFLTPARPGREESSQPSDLQSASHLYTSGLWEAVCYSAIADCYTS